MWGILFFANIPNVWDANKKKPEHTAKMSKVKRAGMSIALRAVLFNEELSEKIFFEYQDYRTVTSIKNMIEVARRWKQEHNMESYQRWLRGLAHKVAAFEGALNQLVEDGEFEKLCTGINECMHEERINLFVCLAIVRLIKHQKPTGIMESGMVASIARSMQYWAQNMRVQNYWIYCLLNVYSTFSHVEGSDFVYRHTYPMMEEINQHEIGEILDTGIVHALLVSIEEWRCTDYNQESAMNILYKIFAECREFGSEEIIIAKPKNAMDRQISTHLKKRMAIIMMGTQPPVLVAREIWSYQMILLLFLIQTTDATTDVAWSSFTSLKHTLIDAHMKNQHVVSKLIGAGAIQYLVRALQTLVNEGSDPQNICQTMLVLGQLFFGRRADECKVDQAAYAATLLKLYQNFDTIFRDCDNEIPRFNGEWLYNTTIYYLAVILDDIITTHPSALLGLENDIQKFAADTSILRARILNDSARMHVSRLVSDLESFDPFAETQLQGM